MYLYLLYKKINDIFNKININFFNKFFFNYLSNLKIYIL